MRCPCGGPQRLLGCARVSGDSPPPSTVGGPPRRAAEGGWRAETRPLSGGAPSFPFSLPARSCLHPSIPSPPCCQVSPRPVVSWPSSDGSAFYVSCERVFDPALEGVPVAVLSNNDGCVIARSQEVKEAGVKMGEPFFKCRDRLAAMGARVFSSNYALYGDMSRRVMDTLETVAADVAPYSIDEAFLSVPTPKGAPAEVCAEMEARARAIRARVLRWTGIPVRVSWAETKDARQGGERVGEGAAGGRRRAVRVPVGPPRARALALVHAGRRRVGRRAPVGDAAGGDGRRHGRRPRRRPRRRAPPAVQRGAGPDGGRAPGHAVSPARRRRRWPARRSSKSRSFGEPVTALGPLSQAVATHAARAAENLRREGLVAGRISAFVTTKGFGCRAAPVVRPGRGTARGHGRHGRARGGGTAVPAAGLRPRRPDGPAVSVTGRRA